MKKALFDRLVTSIKQAGKIHRENKAAVVFLGSREWQAQAIDEALKEADKPTARFRNHADVVSKIKRKSAAMRKGKSKEPNY